MADTKITALTALTAADPANDVIPIVDVSDTTMAASGTTKKISVNNILSSSPTASGALTVAGLVTAGSATITGALTVDTSTLVVDATNDRVGMGTATPGSRLDVRFATNPAINNAVPTNALRVFTSVAQAVDVGGQIGLGGLYNATDFQAFGNISGKKENSTSGNNAGYLVVGTCDSGGTMAERYRIGSTGISTWSVAGTTAMTLDSTGLGIGGSPSYKLHVAGSNPTAAINSTLASISSIATLLYRNVDGNSATQSVASIAGETAGNGGYGNLIFSTGFNGSLVERMRIDLSGNLILQSSATPATLGTNGMLTVNATSNTNLRFSYRGSDGTTRVANLTLA